MQQARQSDEETTTRRGHQASPLSAAVQGLPWWGGGVGQQTTTLQPVTSSPLKSLFVEYSSGIVRPPLSLVHACSLQQSSAPVLVQNATEGQVPSLVAARILPLPSSGYDEGRADEQRQYSATPAVISHLSGEYIVPHTQLELGHSLALATYPYADHYFGGMAAAYGAQAMIHPHMQGVQQARMPLPSEMTEEEPVYVNAKQYHGILRRRQSRAKAESENRLIKTRKPYLHESRHLHAMRRARGCGGRFLNTKSKTESKSSADGNVSSSGQSSQEATTSDSFETRVEPSLVGSPNQVDPTVQGLSDHLMVGMGQSVNGGGCHPGLFSHGSHPMMSSGTGHGNYHNHLNQGYRSSVFHPLPGGSNEGDSGQGGGIMSAGSQQRVLQFSESAVFVVHSAALHIEHASCFTQCWDGE